MILKSRSNYKNGDGQIVRIVDLIKGGGLPEFPGRQVFWSLFGEWYLDDGTKLNYGQVRSREWEHFPSPRSNSHLIEEIDDPDWWEGVKS